MPKPQPPKDKSQAERFAETAREHDADESGERFERAFGKIVPPKKPPKPKSQPETKKPGK